MYFSLTNWTPKEQEGANTKAYDLAALRKHGGITQGQLAERLGWNANSLIDVERGRIDITEEQHRVMRDLILTMHKERKEKDTCLDANSTAPELTGASST